MQESRGLLAAIMASLQAYLQLEAESAMPAASSGVETGAADKI